jgi:hypothetical protein
MYFCPTYNNCFVNAAIKSIVLYQKVNFVTFESTGVKHENYFFKIPLFDDKTHGETPSTCRKGHGQRM